MRALAYEGGVTDFRDGFDRRLHPDPLRQFNSAAVAKRGSDQRGSTRGRIGTSGPDPSREASGNSHQANHSLFYLSKRTDLQVVNPNASELSMVQPHVLNVCHSVNHQLLLQPENPLTALRAYQLSNVERCVGPDLGRWTTGLIGVYHFTPERMRKYEYST